MDYIPVGEFVLVTVAGFVLVGTIRGLRHGEVHFPVQFLFEDGYTRDHPKFRRIVVTNFTLAGALIGLAVLNLILVYSGAR